MERPERWGPGLRTLLGESGNRGITSTGHRRRARSGESVTLGCDPRVARGPGSRSRTCRGGTPGYPLAVGGDDLSCSPAAPGRGSRGGVRSGPPFECGRAPAAVKSRGSSSCLRCAAVTRWSDCRRRVVAGAGAGVGVRECSAPCPPRRARIRPPRMTRERRSPPPAYCPPRRGAPTASRVPYRRLLRARRSGGSSLSVAKSGSSA